MAQIDEINQRLEDCVDEAEAIKTKIKDVAESKGITVVDGTDTPITALTKIDNATVPTPSGSITITTNTTTDVTNYASVVTLVPTHEGEPIEISTAAGMSAVLIAANVGKVYRFTGTTDSTYTNGDLYEVEEVT